ncbi:P-loop containing nucleoside triphosphate hydrolase protein, partial [Gigaspora rosea]
MFLDLENRVYFLYISVQRWLSVRLETISNILIFFASLFAIIFKLDVGPSIIGLVLAYILQTTQTFNLIVNQSFKLETDMNSVEHLVYYCNNLEDEAKNIVLENRLPLVLKGISVDIKAAEKIRVIGRTGCGKSTFAKSFFRFIEVTSGSIVIDNIDISTIGLKDLRINITIISQDSVLFNKPIMLDSPIKENGSNFLQSQQQLIAIARELVQHSKLIIMDEATASIDFKTDNLIQTTISNVFKNSTVIIIVHRL